MLPLVRPPFGCDKESSREKKKWVYGICAQKSSDNLW